jgi:hypothetical protein
MILPYNCKICTRSVPLIAFEPLVWNWFAGQFASLSLRTISINVG